MDKLFQFHFCLLQLGITFFKWEQFSCKHKFDKIIAPVNSHFSCQNSPAVSLTKFKEPPVDYGIEFKEYLLVFHFGQEMVDFSMSTKREINSFAVFDLETTGLPDYNFNKANITELTIHGFPADDVRKEIPSKKRRLNHSLTLLFNPRMMIDDQVERITGLNNHMLEYESPFNENAANMIINFLKHLRQPVCLVAHNGDRFDFPILKTAFEKLGMEIPSDIMCLDSYIAIPLLDKKREEDKTSLPKECLTENADFKLNTIPFLNDDERSSKIPNSTDDKTPPTAPLPADDFKQPDNTLESTTTENITNQKEEDSKLNVDWQKINETTPKQGTDKKEKLIRKTKFESNVASKKLIPRSLNFTTPTETASPSLRRPAAGFYKLENIYIRLFGEKPEVTHQAEADVILLKEIMFNYGDSFVKCAEENAKPFNSVKPLCLSKSKKILDERRCLQVTSEEKKIEDSRLQATSEGKKLEDSRLQTTSEEKKSKIFACKRHPRRK